MVFSFVSLHFLISPFSGHGVFGKQQKNYMVTLQDHTLTNNTLRRVFVPSLGILFPSPPSV